MLILLLDLLKYYLNKATPTGDELGPFRVLTFISVRAALSLGMSFILALAIGPWMIRRLAAHKAGQVIRKSQSLEAVDLSAMHGGKAGTPTMGGLLILAAFLPPVLLFCRLTSIHVILLLIMALGYGALGFFDDLLKITQQHHKGVTPMRKMAAQAGLGMLLGLVLLLFKETAYYAPTNTYGYTHLLLPFVKNAYVPLSFLFIPFIILVMLATSNAVNLTDGLDGLAIGVSIANVTAFLIIAYLVSRGGHDPTVLGARYLYVPFINGGEEIAVFLAALLGASLGFLWFNAHPAQVFMGDTGSMMIGGVLGTTAILLKQELLLIVIGGIFVVESLSVLIQVTSFKLTGTRYFRMSPLHHHFEKTGVHESKIIIRFWIVSWLLAMAGLAMLKLR